MHFRLLDFIVWFKPPPAAAGHMEQVEEEADRVVRAAASIHDVIRNVVEAVKHGDSHAGRPTTRP